GRNADPCGRHGSRPRSSPSVYATMCCRRCPPTRRRAPAPRPPRAASPSPAGCGRALWCGGTARHRARSTAVSKAGPGVELDDQPIPLRGSLPQLRPEALAAPPFKIFKSHTLLLDPSVIAKIEYPRALDMGQFENVVVGGAEQMLS